MPTRLFYSKQHAALDAFPDLVTPEDQERFFRFSDLDQRFVRHFGDGAVDAALMLGALRMFSFVSGSAEVSAGFVDFVSAGLKASQLQEVVVTEVAARSRRDRVIAVVDHAGWRRPNRSDLKLLDGWLLERAMEHDKPAILFGLTLDWLFAERVVRPGITVIEQAVAKASEQAWDETFDRLSLGLSDG